MADRFKRSPALDYLGILPSEREWVLSVDLAAWGVLEQLDAERAENESRAMKDLPPLPSKFSKQRKPASDTVTIKVGGVKRQMPLPPPGWFYGPDGVLIRPQQTVRRF